MDMNQTTERATCPGPLIASVPPKMNKTKMTQWFTNQSILFNKHIL